MAAPAKQTTRLAREDFRKAKELEELRKTGSAPPAVDEDGKMINPHIPQYMSSAPWYLNATEGIGLKHQTLKHFGKESEIGVLGAKKQWYDRGKKKQVAGGAFRKGACENCGAMTHKKKDCLERPRKTSAKKAGKTFAADDAALPSLNLDFDGKRDRWNGYDTASYKRVIDRYEKTDAERRKKKEAELDAAYLAKKKLREERKAAKNAKLLARADKRARRAAAKAAGGDAAAALSQSESESSSSDSDASDSGGNSDDEGLADAGHVLHGDKEKGVNDGIKTTSRNLRIREDTVKYLRNLKADTHYDPKTRSMRSNPHADLGLPAEELQYAGDNFVRQSGQVQEFAALREFVSEAQEKGNDAVHNLANPSAAELMFAQYKKRKEALKEKKKVSILERYGGNEHMQAPDRKLLVNQTEAYAEYDGETGEVVHGQEKAVPQTKYGEDVLEQNHKNVWGSFFDKTKGRWGYACCQQITRNAYCTGSALQEATGFLQKRAAITGLFNTPGGESASAAAAKANEGDGDAVVLEVNERARTKEEKRLRKEAEKAEKAARKRKEAEEAEDDEVARKRQKLTGDGEKKNAQGYNTGSSGAVEPTEQEMEEYYKQKRRDADAKLFTGGKDGYDYV